MNDPRQKNPAAPARPLSRTDSARLLAIADLIEKEAEAWREGWAVWRHGKWDWSTCPKDGQWVHARVVKLESARDFIRGLCAKKTDSAVSDVPEVTTLLSAGA